MAVVSPSPSLVPLLFFARVSGLVVAVLVLFWALAFKSSFLPHTSSQQYIIFAVCYICSLSLSNSLHVFYTAQKWLFFFFFLFFLLFNFWQALHPLFMVIGFILISGEGSERTQKLETLFTIRAWRVNLDNGACLMLYFVFLAILVHRWLPGSRNFKKSVHLCLQGVALASGVFGIWTKFQGEDGIVANFFSLHSWMGLICVSLFGAQVFFFHSLNFTNFSFLNWYKIVLYLIIFSKCHC